ncbi:hypothetical protein BJP34_08595 [Moorena producens PAL-8-15-08-1]|uniref:Uncharacterized protein n=2 Tax=Moorena TaxID=1155738 RepID=A0A1D8TPL1_9CYAN|nr:hypothetical protein BJP34_08595 [Moorena producens PAL-8-15-08-1]
MEDSPYSSTLGQRLQRRLVKPAGVINTQQLHSHYQATQGTAGRLVQKSMLPEQVKFRYGSGVLQPTAIMSRLQRQRTESADGFDGQWRVNPDGYSGTGKTAQTFVQTQPIAFHNSRDNSREIVGKSPTAIGVADSGYDSAPLAPQRAIPRWGEQNSESPPKLGDLGGLTKTRRSPIHTSIQQRPAISQKVTVMTKPLVKETNHNQTTTPVSLVEKKPKSASSSPLGNTIKDTGEKGSRQGTQPQLKINRKATLAEVNTLSRHESHAVQAQRDTKSITKSSTNSTVTQTKPETSSSSSPPYPEKSGTLRISRKATMTAANARAYFQSFPQDLDPPQPPLIRGEPYSKSPFFKGDLGGSPSLKTRPSNVARVQSKSIPDLPLAQTNSPSSPTTVSRKDDNEDTVIQAKLSPTSGKLISQGTTISKASHSQTISHSNSSPDLPLAKTTSASSPTTVSRKEDNEDTVIQAKLSPNSGKLISQTPTISKASHSQTISHSNSSPDLPLAKTTSASSPTTVSRKEDSSDTVIQAKLSPTSGKLISESPTISKASHSQTRSHSNSSPDLPLAKTTSASSPSQVSRKEDNEETVIQAKLSPTSGKLISESPTISKASHSQTRSHSNSSPDLPLAKTTSASSPSQVSRKEDNEETVIQAKLSPNSGKLISESPTISKASHSQTISHSNSSLDLPLAKTTSASSPSQVSRKEDNEETVIQAKLSPNSGKLISESPTLSKASHSQTISHSNSSLDFPLAKTTSASSPTTVSRKEDNEETVIQAKIIPNQPKSGQITSQGYTISKASHSQTITHSNSSPDLPLAKTNNPSYQSQVSRKEDSSDTVIQAKVIPNYPKLGQITSQGDTISKASHSQTITHSNSSPDLPLAKTNSPSYQSTIQAKNQPLSKGIIQTKLAEKNYQPTGIIQKQQGNLPVQLSQKASIASNPSVVSTTPTQLSSSSELNRVWLKTTNTIEANTIEASKGLSTTSSHHQKLPLPLAITQIKPNGAIARQTNAVENSTVQAKSGNATTPMSTPETASASGIDLTKVAEKVSRILARKLMVERERRGIGKWH